MAVQKKRKSDYNKNRKNQGISRTIRSIYVNKIRLT